MIGVVLCGGLSQRMGTDKSSMQYQGKTWAEHSAGIVSEAGADVFYSVNASQSGAYAQQFGQDRIITDNNSLLIRGPLLGLLSAHLRFPSEDILVLACDMLLMKAAVIKELVNAYSAAPGAGAWLFVNKDQPEPLCGIYSASGLAHVLVLYEQQKLDRHSMKYVIDHLESVQRPIPSDQIDAFQNFNAHAPLNGL